MPKKITNGNYDYDKKPQGANPLFDLKLDKRTRRFLKAISKLRKPKILEIGMGQGRFLKKIAEFRPDAKLFGIDISETAIEVAKNNHLLKGTFFVGNAENLPFSKTSFDVVVIMDVLEHVDNPKKVISEVNRVLKPNGIFHFYVPCENQPFTIDSFLGKIGLLKDFTNKHFGHIQYFSHKDVLSLVQNDFSKISILYSDHLLSQICQVFIIYFPKTLSLIFTEDAQIKIRDNYNSMDKIEDKLIFLAKLIWSVFTFPVCLFIEIEAIILRNSEFTAKGIHLTCFKR